MQVKWLKSFGLALLVILSTLGYSEAAGLKALICYDGPTNDKGFNELTQSGFAKGVAKYFPQAQTTSAINTKTDKLQRGDIKELEQKWNLVVGVGDKYADLLTAEAKLHPETKYVVLDGARDKNLNNLAYVQFNNIEAGYLAGIIAAASTKTGNIGFIGGVKKNNAVQEFLTGYKGGAFTVNPNTKVHINYVKSFYNPSRLKDTALNMYADKVDVVFAAAGKSGEGLIPAAAETKKWAIGCDSDQLELAPLKAKPFILTSILKRMDKVMYNLLGNLAQDRFQPGIISEDYDTKGISYVDNAANKQALAKARPYLRDVDAQLMLGQLEIPMVE